MYRLPQAALALPLVPFLQQTGQGKEEFLLQMIHAAPIELMSLGVLAHGQVLHEPLLKIVLVFRQDCFQRIVQEPQVLFQLGKVASGDGGISLFHHAEAVFASVEGVVLAEVLGVGVIGCGLLVLAGVVCFIRLPTMPFAYRPPEAFIFQSLNGGLRDFHIHQSLIFSSALSIHFHERAERLFAGGAVSGDICKGIGGPDDDLLAGVGICCC